MAWNPSQIHREQNGGANTLIHYQPNERHCLTLLVAVVAQ